MRILAVLLALCLAVPAMAQDSMPPAPWAYRQLDDPAQEARAQALMETLRCLKCQSQSIADSDAPMAGDMRSQVRERIAAGEDPEAIRAWLVERYGWDTGFVLFFICGVIGALFFALCWRAKAHGYQ